MRKRGWAGILRQMASYQTIRVPRALWNVGFGIIIGFMVCSGLGVVAGIAYLYFLAARDGWETFLLALSPFSIPAAIWLVFTIFRWDFDGGV